MFVTGVLCTVFGAVVYYKLIWRKCDHLANVHSCDTGSAQLFIVGFKKKIKTK